jgi:hypothetical protein
MADDLNFYSVAGQVQEKSDWFLRIDNKGHQDETA